MTRAASRRCVACASAADSFCSRCGVTPYCSQQCQQRDWARRHKEVCHNLMRLGDREPSQEKEPSNSAPIVPPAAPLRRPHSPKRDNTKIDYGATGAQNKNLSPAGHNHASRQTTPNNNRQTMNNSNGENMNGHDNDSAMRKMGPNHDRTSGRRPPLRHEVDNQKQNQESPFTTKTSQPVQPKTTETVYPKAEVQIAAEVKPTRSQVQKVEVNGVAKAAAKEEVIAGDMVPKKYVTETLSIGDKLLLSVDNKASECRVKSEGFVCLSMHESVESQYQMLCEDYVLDCEADTEQFTPSPGDSFSYFNPEDGAWYRARSLSPTTAALIDSAKLITLSKDSKYKKLSNKYRDIPEFCCILQADVKIGDNLLATLVSKDGATYKVSIDNVDSNKSCGEGKITRWIPEVEVPAQTGNTAGAVGSVASKPSVPRPDVVNNSEVLLVDATAADKVFVRPSDAASQRDYDSVLHDVIMHGMEASPLEESPMPGDTVIAKFTDGVHYRALVIRRNVKMNKYLVEYIEFGNQEISNLESLYPCPSSLQISSRPTLVSNVKLEGNTHAFAKPAIEYIEKLKDDCVELVLTIPSGEKSFASGAAVNLVKKQNKESVNNKIEALSTPEWKKIEERGGDVLEVKPLMLSDLEYLELPKGACTLDILDVSMLTRGNVSGCDAGNIKHMDFIAGKLSQQMEEYCNSELGREPYLPNVEELCIAQCPPYPQWFRAVVCEQRGGAGGATVSVLYVDYGNMEELSCSALRKMLPEWVRGVPALAAHIELKDFPENPTEEMIIKALTHMQMTEEGRGVLKVTRCIKHDDGTYLVEAPELIAAMNR